MNANSPAPVAASELAAQVARLVQSTPAYDLHTHLYDPAFGELLLWGIDDLLVYHYLIAESLRQTSLPFADFWRLPKTGQADLVWDALFVRHSPLSEACRGVLTTLHALGLDVRRRDLPALRQWFAQRNLDRHITECMELAGVRRICMTNSPFDPLERPVWERGFQRDERFAAALRIDPLLLAWPETAAQLREWGYAVGNGELDDRAFSAVRRFLADWSRKIDAQFLMVSLPPDFTFPGRSPAAQLLQGAVLPHCRDTGLPFALMPGVRRQVNPLLRMAGDGLGLTDLRALENLCAGHPENKFLATVLARENQHELTVLARKFRNLHIFGCWWFLNIPSLIDEITRMRVELLGLSFTPQHSDARILDQLVYKWRHSREIITRVLVDKYSDLARTGWDTTPDEMARDVRNLLGGSFEQFLRQ